MKAKKWDEAQAELEKTEKLLTADPFGSLDFLRLNILFGKEDYPAAYKLVSKMSDEHKGEPDYQNGLAWQIVSDPAIKNRDLKLAETCAVRANEAAKGKDENILDTLARVKFMQGRKEESVALEEKAAGIAGGDLKAQFQKALESYKRGELPKAD